MRHCTNCGNELAPEASFCSNCGTNVKKETRKKDNFENKKRQELKNVNKKGGVGSILRWVLLIFGVLLLASLVFALASLVVEGIVNLIGLHAIPIFFISFFFLLGVGLLILKGIQIKKTSKEQPAKIPFLIKAGFLALVFVSIGLFFKAIEIKELPKKYEQAMNALKSEEWDKAVQIFSEIKSFSKIKGFNDKYKDTAERFDEAKYKRAKDLLVNAMDNYSKEQFSASVDSTEKAISLLKDTQGFNKSENLLAEAKEFLNRVKNKEQIVRNNEQNCKNETLAYLISQSFVEKSLKSPSTAVFPNISKEGISVQYLGECTHEVFAYVDAQNSFGGMIRTRYYARVRYDERADTWHLEELSWQ